MTSCSSCEVPRWPRESWILIGGMLNLLVVLSPVVPGAALRVVMRCKLSVVFILSGIVVLQ